MTVRPGEARTGQAPRAPRATGAGRAAPAPRAAAGVAGRHASPRDIAAPAHNGTVQHRTRRERPDARPARGETPRARGERTRQRVAEALISLLEEGNPAPTAKAVADRAGVSVRLVFHHFEDMEALYRMVMTLQGARHWSTVREVEPDLPLGERIERTVNQRAKLFAAVGSVRRAAIGIATRRQDIADVLAASDGLLRKWLATTFAPELAAAGRRRRELLDALEAGASWEVWDRLRRSQGLSPNAARRVMGHMLAALLSA